MNEQPEWFGQPFSDDELETLAAPATRVDLATRQKLVQEIRVLRWLAQSLAGLVDLEHADMKQLRQSEAMKLARFLVKDR